MKKCHHLTSVFLLSVVLCVHAEIIYKLMETAEDRALLLLSCDHLSCTEISSIPVSRLRDIFIEGLPLKGIRPQGSLFIASGSISGAMQDQVLRLNSGRIEVCSGGLPPETSAEYVGLKASLDSKRLFLATRFEIYMLELELVVKEGLVTEVITDCEWRLVGYSNNFMCENDCTISTLAASTETLLVGGNIQLMQTPHQSHVFEYQPECITTVDACVADGLTSATPTQIQSCIGDFHSWMAGPMPAAACARNQEQCGVALAGNMTTVFEDCRSIDPTTAQLCGHTFETCVFVNTSPFCYAWVYTFEQDEWHCLDVELTRHFYDICHYDEEDYLITDTRQVLLLSPATNSSRKVLSTYPSGIRKLYPLAPTGTATYDSLLLSGFFGQSETYFGLRNMRNIALVNLTTQAFTSQAGGLTRMSEDVALFEGNILSSSPFSSFQGSIYPGEEDWLLHKVALLTFASLTYTRTALVGGPQHFRPMRSEIPPSSFPHVGVGAILGSRVILTGPAGVMVQFTEAGGWAYGPLIETPRTDLIAVLSVTRFVICSDRTAVPLNVGNLEGTDEHCGIYDIELGDFESLGEDGAFVLSDSPGSTFIAGMISHGDVIVFALSSASVTQCGGTVPTVFDNIALCVYNVASMQWSAPTFSGVDMLKFIQFAVVMEASEAYICVMGRARMFENNTPVSSLVPGACLPYTALASETTPKVNSTLPPTHVHRFDSMVFPNSTAQTWFKSTQDNITYTNSVIADHFNYGYDLKASADGRLLFYSVSRAFFVLTRVSTATPFTSMYTIADYHVTHFYYNETSQTLVLFFEDAIENGEMFNFVNYFRLELTQVHNTTISPTPLLAVGVQGPYSHGAGLSTPPSVVLPTPSGNGLIVASSALNFVVEQPCQGEGLYDASADGWLPLFADGMYREAGDTRPSVSTHGVRLYPEAVHAQRATIIHLKYASARGGCGVGQGRGFNRTTASEECVPCLPGTVYNADIGDCAAVPPGYYTSTHGATSAVPCPMSSSNTRSGMTTCEPCRPGTYAPVPGSQCLPCPAGYFGNTTGLAQCLRCPLGTYTDKLGQTACKLCPNNTFGIPLSDVEEEDGGVACRACPSGATSGAGSRTATACVCSHDRVLGPDPSAFSNYSCVCSKGHTFSAVVEACVACGSTEYKPVIGNGDCIPCPSYSSSFDTVTCTCFENYYQPVNSTTCERCPSGGLCTGGLLYAEEGHWRVDSGATTFFECEVEEACGPTGCHTGYRGRLCSDCESGYGPTEDGKCAKCSTNKQYGMVAGYTVIILLFFAYIFKASSSPSFPKLQSTLNFLQMLSLINIENSNLLKIFGVFLGNPSFGWGTCMFEFGYWSMWGFKMAVPLVFEFFVLIMYFLKRQRTLDDRFSAAATFEEQQSSKAVTWGMMCGRAALGVISYTYLIVTRGAVRVFNCQSIGGAFVLVDKASVECYEGFHLYAVFFAVFVLVVVSVGLPLYLFLALFTRSKLPRCLRRLDLSHLMVNFKPECAGYELFIVLRRLIFILVAEITMRSSLIEFRTMLLVGVILAAISVHLNFLPFKLASNNHHESTLLHALAAIYILEFVANGMDTDTGALVVAILILLITVCVIIFLFVRAVQVRYLEDWESQPGGKTAANKDFIEMDAAAPEFTQFHSHSNASYAVHEARD